VAVEAVTREPVSSGQFPDTRENTGNLLDFRLGLGLGVQKTAAITATCGQIPCAGEQGIFSAEQGTKIAEQGTRTADQGCCADHRSAPYHSARGGSPRASLGLSIRRLEFVLCLRLEVARLVPFVELTRGLARDAVHHPTSPRRRAGGDRLRPTLDILVVLHLQELTPARSPYPQSCSRDRQHIRSLRAAERAHRVPRPPALCSWGISRSITAHSASVRSDSYRRPARLCRPRVAGVPMVLADQASAIPIQSPLPRPLQSLSERL
jgi:hypothetical protein